MNKERILELFSLEEKVAIITGGNGMLGQQYTQVLRDAGAKVFCFDIKSIKDGVDITNKRQVKKAVENIKRTSKKIDILINNAALNPPPGDSENYLPYEKSHLKRWQEEIKVGLTGAQICTQAIAPIMMDQRSGVIINISSDLGVIAPDNRIYEKGRFKSVAYVTVKTALIGLTRAWASYLAPFGIRVNAIAPGGVFTGQNPEFVEKNSRLNMLGRMARKDEYNGAILFLCSDASSYMTGSVLSIDGGRTAW